MYICQILVKDKNKKRQDNRNFLLLLIILFDLQSIIDSKMTYGPHPSLIEQEALNNSIYLSEQKYHDKIFLLYGIKFKRIEY